MIIFQFVLLVWEVRHGSVMALREILTHQGASAGVLKPDSPMARAQFAESEDKNISNVLEDKNTSNVLKREREIDLNMQVSVDEFESNLKRPKLEDLSSTTSMNSMNTCGNEADVEIGVSAETCGFHLPLDCKNGQYNGSSVNMNQEFHSESYRYSCEEPTNIGDMKDYYDGDKNPSGNLIMIENSPQNSQLMKLVKVARNSWLRNCDFLQDCVIRLLCVLSLERYDIFGLYVYVL